MSSKTMNPDYFIRLPQVLARTGHKRTTWLTLVKTGQAPAPVPIGPRCVAWSSQEIRDWISTRKAQARTG